MPDDGGGVAALIESARSGSSQAWDALVARFGGRVWAVCRAYNLGRADAEDVFQVVWMRLVNSLDTIREPDRLGAWLATTARHECLRVLRKAGRQVPVGDDAGLDRPDVTTPGPDAGLLRTEREAALWAALGDLSPECQRLLRVMLADPPPSYLEVSEALGMPVGSIGPTRGRCLNHLRSKLRGIYGAAAGSS